MSKLDEIKVHQLKYKFSETKDILWLIEQAEKVEAAKEIFKDIEIVQTWDEWEDKDLSKRVTDFINN